MRLAFASAVAVSSLLFLACASGSEDVNDPGVGDDAGAGGSNAGAAGTKAAGGKAGKGGKGGSSGGPTTAGAGGDSGAAGSSHGEAGAAGLGGKTGLGGKGGAAGSGGSSGKGGSGGSSGKGGSGGSSGKGGSGGSAGKGGSDSGSGGSSGKGGAAGSSGAGGDSAQGGTSAGEGGAGGSNAGGAGQGGVSAGGSSAGGMTGGGAANCAHDACVEGVALSATCSADVKIVCDYDDFCCDPNNSWDDFCTSYGASIVGCNGEQSGLLACVDTLDFAWKKTACKACYLDCLDESGQTDDCDYDFYDSEAECWSYCGNDTACVCGCAALVQPKARGCSDAVDGVACCAASAKAYTCIADKCASKCL
jgi:hypothetical protein